jgi:hypothetical protein
MRPQRFLGPEQQVSQRLIVQLENFGAGPVVARGGHGLSLKMAPFASAAQRREQAREAARGVKVDDSSFAGMMGKKTTNKKINRGGEGYGPRNAYGIGRADD